MDFRVILGYIVIVMLTSPIWGTVVLTTYFKYKDNKKTNETEDTEE